MRYNFNKPFTQYMCLICVAVFCFLFSNKCCAQNIRAPFVVDLNYSRIEAGSVHEIENMPAVLDQSVLGICFGCAAATIVQKYLCDETPEIKQLKIACAQLPQEIQVSTLGMVAWSDTNKDRVSGRDDNPTPGLTSNHQNLKLYDDRSEYSNGANALQNVAKHFFRLYPESCYPMSKLLLKYRNSSARFEQAYGRMKAAYNRSVAERFSDESVSQLTVVANEEMEMSIGADAVRKLIDRRYFIKGNHEVGDRKFAEFLFFFVFEQCKPSINFNFMVAPYFDMNYSSVQRMEALDVIKRAIDKGRPLLVSSFCLQYDLSMKRCLGSHSAVIAGYRTNCNIRSELRTCKLQIKIQNCWGAAWQSENNAGWFDAAAFLASVDPEDNEIGRGQFAWLDRLK